MKRAAVALLLLAGLALFGNGAYLQAKAQLAQLLLRVAWERARGGAAAPRPWPWADTTPVARLRFVERGSSGSPELLGFLGRSRRGDPRNLRNRGTDFIVLAGASGRNLAFAPAHLTSSAEPGERGNCVISAHRDTHFTILGAIRSGDRLIVERRDGASFAYEVDDARIVDRRDTSVLFDDRQGRLTLITCWPLDALVPGGPERLVVTARLLPNPPAKSRTNRYRDTRPTS